MQYFYDKQIRRFINQFVRIFSEFFVEYGKDVDGNPVLYRVPVRYADTNRNVSAILKSVSENSLNSVPVMVIYIDAMKYDRERVQEPNFVDKLQIRTRAKDPATGELTNNQGNTFTVERLMPVPYRLTLKMEVWTSNFEQKLQILEQVLTHFNPALEVQSTDNYVDWTSLSYVLLTDFTWTTRNIPIGTDDPIDISTVTFELPIWLTTPAKVKKLGVIANVVDSVYDGQGNLSQALVDQATALGNRQYFTPMGYAAIVVNGEGKLVPNSGPVLNSQDLAIPQQITQPIPWQPTINTFGEIKNGISMLYLTNPKTEQLVVGTVAYNPNDPNILDFNVDETTIPVNTIAAVTAIVDPTTAGPNSGLPAPAINQRYLLTNNLGNAKTAVGLGPVAWQNVDTSVTVALANDIIEWDGSKWNKVFDSTTHTRVEFMTNAYTGLQYRWTGTQWVRSWMGLYPEGFWSIVI